VWIGSYTTVYKGSEEHLAHDGLVCKARALMESCVGNIPPSAQLQVSCRAGQPCIVP
jgi:hypothetical protein